VHLFVSDPDRIALSFVTAQGTINTTLPRQLAQQIADGIDQLNQVR